MLQALRVTDYILFGQMDIEFGEHLNVISGETGAGKSILLGAVELLLGGEASERMIRVGAERAAVEGLFKVPEEILPALTEQALVNEETGDEVVIRREISSSGRSKCFINGSLANLSLLRRLGDELIQIHGQQEHQLLTQGAHQLELLDAFGGLECLRSEFAALLSRYKACAKRINELEDSRERRRKEQELMRFQLEEIDLAAPDPEDEKGLQEKLVLLENAERIEELVSGLLAGLEGQEANSYGAAGQDFSVLGSLGVLRRQLEVLAGLAGKVEPLVGQFEEARYTLDEVARALRALAGSIDHDPARLEELRSRRELYYRLKKKYGPTIQDVLAFRDKIKAFLEQAERDESDLDSSAAEKTELSQKLEETAGRLSSSRRKAAARLEEEVSRKLAGLAMAGGQFRVFFDRVAEKDGQPEYLTSGADRVTFLLSTNPGVPLMPLSQVASGGELSRVMLAVKSAMADLETPSTMIFDEVDSGIGGKVGGIVGVYLKEIARKHQVLVITHLAQIATHADTHLVCEKFLSDQRSETRVRQLGQNERPQEIARMLAGDTESRVSLDHARQMLKKTKKESR